MSHSWLLDIPACLHCRIPSELQQGFAMALMMVDQWFLRVLEHLGKGATWILEQVCQDSLPIDQHVLTRPLRGPDLLDNPF